MSNSKTKTLRLTKETVKHLSTKTDIRTGTLHIVATVVGCATGPQCLIQTGYSCAGLGGGSLSKANQQ